MLSDKKIFLWVLVAIAVSTTSVLLFTHFAGALNTTGQIGDTIGGLTAPIINLFTAILLILTLREQQKANKILASDNEFARIDALIKELKSETLNLKYKYTQDGFEITVHNFEALVMYNKTVINNIKQVSEYNEMLFIVNLSETMGLALLILQRIDSFNYDRDEKKFLYTRYRDNQIILIMQLKEMCKCIEDKIPSEFGSKNVIRINSKIQILIEKFDKEFQLDSK